MLQQLGIGEAVVTVMNPKGAPTPVAWTRMFAPHSQMGPIPEESLRPGVAQSALMSTYGAQIDRDSAYEMLTRKLEAGAQAAAEAEAAKKAEAEAAARAKAETRGRSEASTPRARAPRPEPGLVEQVAGSRVFKQLLNSATREIVRGLFGTARRRR